MQEFHNRLEKAGLKKTDTVLMDFTASKIPRSPWPWDWRDFDSVGVHAPLSVDHGECQ